MAIPPGTTNWFDLGSKMMYNGRPVSNFTFDMDASSFGNEPSYVNRARTLANQVSTPTYQAPANSRTNPNVSTDDFRTYVLDNNNTLNPQNSWWDNYVSGLGDYIKQNPLSPLQAIGSFWSTWDTYKNNRENLKLNRAAFNLQKQAYENTEARAQEAFDWQRQARKSAQL